MEHTFFYEKDKVTLTGVTALDSFEEKEVKIRLDGRGMIIKGNSFELIDMAKTAQKVTFTGNIHSVEYVGKADKTSVLKKIFK